MKFLILPIVIVSIALVYFGDTEIVSNTVEKTSNIVSIELTPEQRKNADNAINATEEAIISATEKVADSAKRIVDSVPERGK